MWGVLDIVGRFDLSGFRAAYRSDGVGHPPYDPAMMVALIFYCHVKGVRSGRAIAAACHDDIGCRIITGNRFPHSSTVNDFVSVHAAALCALLPQTLRMGHLLGLVDVSVVAGDGTMVKANAARNASVDRDHLERQIADLERSVDAADAAWQKVITMPGNDESTGDGEGDGEGGFAEPAGPSAPGMPGEPDDRRLLGRMQTLERRLTARREALDRLQAQPSPSWVAWSQRMDADQARVVLARQRLAVARARQQEVIDRRAAQLAAGVRLRGRTHLVPVEQYVRVRQARSRLDVALQRAERTAAKEPPQGLVNTTDPGSAIMPGKHDGFAQRYNVQIVACPGPFILAISTHPSSNDKKALSADLHTTRANLDAADITDQIQTALFDSGYASQGNFTADLPVKTLLVSVTKEHRQTGRGGDGNSTVAAAWAQMQARMAEPDHAALYKRRSAIVEPAFAQLFARLGRDVLRRGDGVETELHLWAITHNLHKIIQAGMRPNRPD